ncbi:PREDICTED: diacylglycerol kinase [Prunus dulcis]|uniref:PREDICTED: diacylglycerol kinase n=1 Tax=Prunus dulcis TaxID=3755 RepID=A0A5E4FNJ9_PRUDU|nr:PREDICTED: diacylglycerol kinase [Prunus dulcis]
MRIIVVGRDAIVNWILGVICDLKLPESPSIAPVPLRYHYNGIGASFGWKDISNISPLQSFLVDVALAKPLRTDSWHCLIRMKRTQSSTGRPYASFMDPLPHCLHEVGDVEKAGLGCGSGVGWGGPGDGVGYGVWLSWGTWWPGWLLLVLLGLGRAGSVDGWGDDQGGGRKGEKGRERERRKKKENLQCGDFDCTYLFPLQ